MRTSRVAEGAGAVLAGRYRLVAPIGTGASGQVYAAWDSRLRRKVAVKVLHPALAEDASFLRRFRAEAQMAASLHHPNVVTVFDWGSGPSGPDGGVARAEAPAPEPGLPFIVLELLSGGSLRALLDAGTRLTPAQAAAVGRQVAAALAYAHGRGLIHRDVKPANLLFDERGTVKVADFGLVRALAEASWTEPAGTVLGTARYAAPEQVHGHVDARSDQYALALVLVEAVTGTVPFAAETTLSSLLSRVERHLSVPDDLGPLGPVLERAAHPDPGARWDGAAAFGAALAEAAGRLESPEPLVLPGVALPAADSDPTQLVTAPVTTPSPSPSPGPSPGAAAAPVTKSSPAKPRRRTPSRPGGRRRLFVPLVVVALLVAGVAGALFAVGRAAGTPLRVPNLIGLQEASAKKEATTAGFEVRVSRMAADDPKGTVLEHAPAAGRLLGEGRAIRLVVSSGPRPVDLAPVTGQALADAQAALEGAGFVVAVSHAFHEDIPAGAVAGQDPPAGPTAPGSEIRLVVSDGPKPVTVPDVTGNTVAQAEEVLSGKRFAVTRVDVFSDEVEAGEVIRSEPRGGVDAPRDSVVKLVVSKGPDLVEVPDVVGEELDEAIEILERDGFEVDLFGYGRGRSVRRQEPSPGELLRRGSTVTLLF